MIEQNLEVVQTWLEEIGLSRATATLQPGTALLPRDKASEARIDATLQSMGLAQSPIAILNPGAGWGAKQWAPSALRRAGHRSRRARAALGRSTMAPARRVWRAKP